MDLIYGEAEALPLLSEKEVTEMPKEMRTPFLPDPFLKENGTRVTTPAEWPEQAAYIRRLAQDHMYGQWPAKPVSITARANESKQDLFEKLMPGKVVREYLTLTIDEKWELDVEYVHPADGKYPVIVYNASPLGMRSRIERDVLNAGYGVAAFNREQVRPDFQLADLLGYLEEAKSRTYPELDCGDIMAWGWGHSVVADYLRTRPEVGELICTGHSRGGKAALCAGIFDDRFEVVAPIGSGCGGAGSARFLGTLALDKQDEKSCETIGSMANMFPTWMCAKYAEYGPKEPPYVVGEEVEFFPIDSHMLRAACAPRAVFNSEGDEDLWCNAFGTQLGRDAAQKVFDFLGVSDRNGFHIRHGGHDFSSSDWAALIDFCDIVLHRERSMPQADTTSRVFVIDLKKYAPWAE